MIHLFSHVGLRYERVVAQSMQLWMDGFCGLLAARDAPGAGCQLKLKVAALLLLSVLLWHILFCCFSLGCVFVASLLALAAAPVRARLLSCKKTRCHMTLCYLFVRIVQLCLFPLSFLLTGRRRW
jgi:hypothetical protein